MRRDAKQILDYMRGAISRPDRRSTVEWAEQEGFQLPGSLRSSKFRIDIAPWLKLPFEFADDPEVRRLLLVAAVQSSKSTIGEVVIGRKMATDPGNMLYSWEDHGKAEELWNDRIERTIRQAKQLRHRLPPKNIKQRRMEIQFTDGFYFRIQGIKATKSRQSKSVRYLINEEVKDWDPGAVTDLRNRVTAAWNSFELNITPASEDGDEVHTLWKESSQHVLHIRCPECEAMQIPRFRTHTGKLGGLHFCDPADPDALAKCKDAATGEYNYTAIAEHCYYECEGCGHRMRDTPKERTRIANTGDYISLNPEALPTDKACSWNALIVPWIPWVGLIREFHNAIRAMRYGDISLYKEFVQKREVQFFKDDMDDFIESDLTLSEGVKKSRDGLGESKQFRFMMVDKQRGSPRKNEAPHYWVVIRDWKPGASALVWEGKVQTDEELEDLRLDHDVQPFLVAVDSGDGMTTIDVYKMCAKYGYIALKGEDKSGYTHNKDGTKTTKRFSPEQTAYATGENGEQIPITLILYSKQGIRDALYYLRTAKDFDFQIPEDVSDDYQKHMDSEQLVDWHIPKTGQKVKIWRQVRKRNDLFVCECYQALYADIADIIGMLPVEARPDGVKAEHRARG
jgi:phage terminase large subunit GpA-like protein